MTNIFEKAYFGKVYKTRDNKKAIYSRYKNHKNCYELLLEAGLYDYNPDGSLCGFADISLYDPYDIISEWQEERQVVCWDKLTEDEKSKVMLDVVSTRKPIDEEELDKLAIEDIKKIALGKDDVKLSATNLWKAGYRKGRILY